MFLYRIEHPDDGVGFMNSCKSHRVPLAYEEYKKFPTPWNDGILECFLRDGCYFFAFKTLEILRSSLSDEALKQLFESGFILYKLEVKDENLLVIGGKQVAFTKENVEYIELDISTVKKDFVYSWC